MKVFGRFSNLQRKWVRNFLQDESPKNKALQSEKNKQLKKS